ncbi:hypothetical protein GCM10017608_27910 [Agromyces luteolus]|uniref:CUE domain-containing protein n=1 Tax=Agromyces luteolus TaxID=88373 RepID=A0A7C9HSP9_9MICO|nr:hypothetical protein [Agromyces luteolus]MUN06105.1 hypothetical protein [Agromyces luteolus]GLK28856.1 hypothetical protein GCM10017608_27910 [Agromyces luteolus]
MGSTQDGSRDDNEQRSVDEVVDRLSKKFPDLDRDEIRRIVDEEHRAFDGRPVRDFVPVLVEKGAKRRIKAAAKSG